MGTHGQHLGNTRSLGKPSRLCKQPLTRARLSMLTFRKTSRLTRTPAGINREFVTEQQCKKAAREVDAGTDKAGVSQ